MQGETGKILWEENHPHAAHISLLIILFASILIADHSLQRSFAFLLIAAFAFIVIHFRRSLTRHPRRAHLVHLGGRYLELARRHSRFRLSVEGDRFYQRAVIKFFKSGKTAKAIDVFSEYFDLYENVFEPRLQLKLCQELCRRGHYELSARALETLLEKWDEVSQDVESIWKEKTYMRLAKILAEKLECTDYAGFLYARFLKEFPLSRFREIAAYQVLALEAKKSEKRLKMAS